MPSPLRARTTQVQTAIPMKPPAAPTSSGGGGGGGGSSSLTTTKVATNKPGTPTPLVFPAWLKWLMIGGVLYVGWKKLTGKKSQSLGSLLEPTRREPQLREFHITEEDD